MKCTILRKSLVLFFLSAQTFFLHTADSDSLRRPLLAATGALQAPSAPSAAMVAGQRRDALCVPSSAQYSIFSQTVEFSIAAIESGEVTSSSLLEGLRTYSLSKNAINEAGETLLAQACRLNCLRAVQLCCAIGVDVNMPDNHGNSPLIIACEHRERAQSDLIRTLLTHGADVNGISIMLSEGSLDPRRSWPRQTPLYLLAGTDKVALVTTMIQLGALFGFSYGGKYLKGARAYDKIMGVMPMTAAMRDLLASNTAALRPSCCCMQ